MVALLYLLGIALLAVAFQTGRYVERRIWRKEGDAFFQLPQVDDKIRTKSTPERKRLGVRHNNFRPTR